MTDSPAPADNPPPTDSGRFVAHARLVFALTLCSRVLGLVRDALCARVFATSGVFSAFVTAFTIPNLFRRLFGEGALTAAFIPAYAQLDEQDPALASRFASLVLIAVGLLLAALVVVGELLLFLLLQLDALGGQQPVVFLYAMVMLPYMPLVCLVAVAGGMLQTHGRFAPHAAAPVVLNVCMIAGVSISALLLGLDVTTSALVLSISVVVAGVLQLAWCLLRLRGILRWGLVFTGCAAPMRSMLSKMLPALIGLGTLQVSTFIDALIAGWPVIVDQARVTVPFTEIAYPLDDAAASVLFYAQRLYQFPLGVFGIAIATAVFPMLSRAAEDAPTYIETLRRGLRLSLFIAVPATVGLIVVREDLTAVIYAGGAFGEASIGRVSVALLAYAPAVWAYSLTHVLTRAFYARGMMRVPMVVGIGTVLLNLALNCLLIWWLQEAGLALATAIAATVQTAVLAWIGAHRLGRWGDVAPRALMDAAAWRSVGFTVLLAAGMGGLLMGLAALWDAPTSGWTAHLVRLAAFVALGGLVYGGAGIVLRRAELRWLVERAASTDRR